MIVPNWIVKMIYKKGSLKNEGDFYSFSFVNKLSSGKITLTSLDTISVTSPLGNLELSSFPILYVDGCKIEKEDVILNINGEDLPRYDEEEAKKRIGESIDFPRGVEIKTKIKGNLSDGKHTFQVIFNSRQFGSIVLNFSDYIGVVPEISIWEKIKSFFFKKRKEKIDLSKYIISERKPDANFGRLKKALICEIPDRVPLLELGIDEEVKCAFLNKEISSLKEEVEFWLSAGYDYVPLWGINITPRKVEFISSHKTTYKEEMQERGFVDENRGVITNFEEFEKYPWPEIEDSNFIMFEEIKKYLPKDIKVIGILNGIFECVSQAMGLQTFCYSLVDQPELVEKMFEKIGNLQLQILKKMVQFDFLGAIWIADDIAYKTSTIISPENLRKYVFCWYKKFSDLAKSKGLPVLFHSDGNLLSVIDDLIDAGISALHPIEPTAMDIKYLKEKYKKKICLCGNIDLCYTLTRGTKEEIEKEVKERIKEIAPSGGYCLGSANSITNYVPLENFLTMNRTAIKYGKYPIKIF
jgi:uroporphyrinogen decarboxylase